MSFLFPAFLLGFAGLAIPIWLHLRHRRRVNVRMFSALRFLDDQPSPRETPLQIRDWLLFLLRLLALAFLVAALSVPFLRRGGPAIQSETRIYLLDNTLSHRVGGAFEKARADIAREIRAAGPQVQTAVVEIAAPSRILVDFNVDHEQAAATVEALPPTFQRGSYLEAFRLASALLDRSLGQRRQILVYGDGQRNQWEENASVPPFLSDVEVVLAEGPGRNGLGNLYTANPRTQRLPDRGHSAVNLLLDIGSQPVNQSAEIRIKSDGTEVLRQAIQPSGSEATVQATWGAESSRWLRGEVSISGQPDALPLDNLSYFVVPPLDPAKVGVLVRSPFLRASLDPELERGYLDVTLLGPDQLRQEAAAGTPRFDALVVESDFLQSQEARELVLRHLNGGRGVLLFVTRDTPLVEGFLRTLGFSAGPERPLGDAAQAFRYANFAHPTLESYANPDFGDLLAIRLKKYLPLESDKADALLYAGDGAPVLFETRGTTGKMLVFGFGAETAFTNWPVRPDFLPFLDRCLHYVRASSDQQVAAEPGEALFREFGPEGQGTYALVGDSGEATRGQTDPQGRLRLRAPGQPGIYELRHLDASGGGRLAGLLSVSPSAKESELDYLDGRPPVLDTWLLSAAPKSAAAAGPAPAVALVWQDQRLWWYLLLTGAAFLAGEMLCLLVRRPLA